MLVPHFSRLKTGISMIDLFQKKGISMMNLLQKQQYAAVLAFKFCLRGINVSDQLRNNFLTLENPSLSDWFLIYDDFPAEPAESTFWPAGTSHCVKNSTHRRSNCQLGIEGGNQRLGLSGRTA